MKKVMISALRASAMTLAAFLITPLFSAERGMPFWSAAILSFAALIAAAVAEAKFVTSAFAAMTFTSVLALAASINSYAHPATPLHFVVEVFATFLFALAGVMALIAYSCSASLARRTSLPLSRILGVHLPACIRVLSGILLIWSQVRLYAP